MASIGILYKTCDSAMVNVKPRYDRFSLVDIAIYI